MVKWQRAAEQHTQRALWHQCHAAASAVHSKMSSSHKSNKLNFVWLPFLHHISSHFAFYLQCQLRRGLNEHGVQFLPAPVCSSGLFCSWCCSGSVLSWLGTQQRWAVASVNDNKTARRDMQTQLPVALSLLGSSAARMRLSLSLNIIPIGKGRTLVTFFNLNITNLKSEVCFIFYFENLTLGHLYEGD